MSSNFVYSPAWSGLMMNWGNGPDCNRWANGKKTTQRGFFACHGKTDYNAINCNGNGKGNYKTCNNLMQVSCVEQAATALVQPANIASAPATTPIEVQFAYEVNPQTVLTGGAFAVVEESGDRPINGHIVAVDNFDGTTTARHNTNFIFTPNKPLKPGYSYKVVLNANGTPNPMQDGVGIAVPPQDFSFTVQSPKTDKPIMTEPPPGERKHIPPEEVFVYKLPQNVDPATISVAIQEYRGESLNPQQLTNAITSGAIIPSCLSNPACWGPAIVLIYSYKQYKLTTEADKYLLPHKTYRLQVKAQDMSGTSMQAQNIVHTISATNTLKFVYPDNLKNAPIYGQFQITSHNPIRNAKFTIRHLTTGSEETMDTTLLGSHQAAAHTANNLLPNATYDITAFVTDTSGSQAEVTIEMTTLNRETNTKLLIYEATNNGRGYSGNLLAEAELMGYTGNNPFAAADYICEHDSAHPGPDYYTGAKVFAGLIAGGYVRTDRHNRYPCTIVSAEPVLTSCTSHDRVNWVLGENTAYYQHDLLSPNETGALIGTTDDSATFNVAVNLAHGIRPATTHLDPGLRAWTGLYMEETPPRSMNWISLTSSNANCLLWENNLANTYARDGSPVTQLVQTAFGTQDETSACTVRHTLYCAQQ